MIADEPNGHAIAQLEDNAIMNIGFWGQPLISFPFMWRLRSSVFFARPLRHLTKENTVFRSSTTKVVE